MDAPRTDDVGNMPPTAVDLTDLAARLTTGLREWYDIPVVRVAGSTVQVPAGNAVGRARALAGDAYASLVQPIDISALPWKEVPADGLQLWRAHGCAGNGTGELVTELMAGDPPVQSIVTHGSWQLVRALDGATGWVAPDADGGERALAPSAEPVPPATFLADPGALADEAERFVGVPYRWGGATGTGIDCSGLVQRAAWQAGGMWLPRHSRHLLHVGRRVSAQRLERGDVLVLKSLGTTPGSSAGTPMGGPAVHPMHVAVALSDELTLHASRDKWAVVREPLSSLQARYRILGARRFDEAAHD